MIQKIGSAGKFYCFIAVCIIVVVVVLLKYNYAYILRPQESGLPGFLREKKIDLLFLGSSCTGQAIDIKRIEQAYNINAYNLSYNSLSPAVAAEILDFIVNHTDIELHTVVVEAYPYKLVVPFLLEDTRIFTDAPAALKNNILKSLVQQEKTLPFSALYELIVTAENESLLLFPVNRRIIDSFFYKGAYINKNVPGQKSFRKMENLPHQRPTYYQIQKDAFLRMIDFCAKKKINLIFVEPFLPKITRDGKTYQHAQKMVSAILIAKNANYFASDKMPLPSDDPSYFTDNIHLSTKGREIYTDEIMKLLALQGCLFCK